RSMRAFPMSIREYPYERRARQLTPSARRTDLRTKSCGQLVDFDRVAPLFVRTALICLGFDHPSNFETDSIFTFWMAHLSRSVGGFTRQRIFFTKLQHSGESLDRGVCEPGDLQLA